MEKAIRFSQLESVSKSRLFIASGSIVTKRLQMLPIIRLHTAVLHLCEISSRQLLWRLHTSLGLSHFRQKVPPD